MAGAAENAAEDMAGNVPGVHGAMRAAEEIAKEGEAGPLDDAEDAVTEDGGAEAYHPPGFGAVLSSDDDLPEVPHYGDDIGEPPHPTPPDDGEYPADYPPPMGPDPRPGLGGAAVLPGAPGEQQMAGAPGAPGQGGHGRPGQTMQGAGGAPGQPGGGGGPVQGGQIQGGNIQGGQQQGPQGPAAPVAMPPDAGWPAPNNVPTLVELNDMDRLIAAIARIEAAAEVDTTQLMRDHAVVMKEREAADAQEPSRVEAAPGFWRSVASGMVGTAMASGTISKVPFLGDFVKQVTNEFYEGPERARVWANAGFGTWLKAQGDAQRLQHMESMASTMGAGYRYEQLGMMDAYTMALKSAHLQAAQAAAKSRDDLVAIRQQEDQRGGQLLTAEDFRSATLANAIQSLETSLQASVIMKGGRVDVGVDGEKVSVKLGPQVLKELVASNATKTVSGQLEKLLADHAYNVEKDKP
jgi:hypothetical protein